MCRSDTKQLCRVILNAQNRHTDFCNISQLILVLYCSLYKKNDRDLKPVDLFVCTELYAITGK